MPEKWPVVALLSVFASLVPAQPAPEMQQVLERLDRLEAQNRELMTEVRALREQLAAANPAPAAAEAADAASPPVAPPAPLNERLDIVERRQAQMDQEKISSDHRLPISLTGMLLFNTFWTGGNAGGVDNPTLASPVSGPRDAGATFRQSVVGLKLDGPQIAWGGKVTGSAYIDFFGGSAASLSQMLRLRVASVNAEWKNTTVSVALDKPILAPREPDSLAQVGVSPLTSAGNLWLWQPQVRVEQRFHFGDQAGLNAQIGVYETSEGGTGLASSYGGSLEKSRPGFQGRFEFWRGGEQRRVEIAPGFHFSDSHVLNGSVPSRIGSVDWLIRPVSRIDVTGQFFAGENVGVLGGLRQGISVSYYGGGPEPVHALGGWAQVKFRLTSRATFNIYGGQEDDRNRDLQPAGIAKNQAYAGNFMYRFGSNILASLEASQVRTTYLFSGTRLFPHYDLAIAYLF